jgi:hypothetical protein
MTHLPRPRVGQDDIHLPRLRWAPP